MSVVEKIQELQQKPEHTRKRILVFSVTALMMAVIGVWLVTTSRNIDRASALPSNAAPATTSAANDSPFHMLRNTIGTSFEDIKNFFNSQ